MLLFLLLTLLLGQPGQPYYRNGKKKKKKQIYGGGAGTEQTPKGFLCSVLCLAPSEMFLLLEIFAGNKM